MRLSPREPIEVLTWAYRLLYVELFLSLMVVMGYWHLPTTVPFLGAVLALLFPVLFSRKELLQIEVEDTINTPE